MSAVGKNIRAIMERQGLSQNRLAKLSGVSQSNISSILSETKSPSVDTVQLIAGALGCSVAELLGETSAAGPQLTDAERQLIASARRLNALGLGKLIDYARDLTENDRYKKETASGRKAE